MDTIKNTIETSSTSHGEKFDISAREKASFDAYLKQTKNKNTRDSSQLDRAHKSQFLIVDEEWW